MMRVLLTGTGYVVAVFAVGFVLGVLRTALPRFIVAMCPNSALIRQLNGAECAVFKVEARRNTAEWSFPL